jgi:hypothetical protein
LDGIDVPTVVLVDESMILFEGISSLLVDDDDDDDDDDIVHPSIDDAVTARTAYGNRCFPKRDDNRGMFILSKVLLYNKMKISSNTSSLIPVSDEET